VADNTACDDRVACTQSDTCQNGICEAGTQVGCKVTGGGQITFGNATGNPCKDGTLCWVSFGFNVHSVNGTPPAKGQLEFNRHSNPKATYHSIQIASLMITPIEECTADSSLSGQQATFNGTIRRKGQAAQCTFEVVVEDCGEPGRNDFFSIDIQGPADCPESRSGKLDHGNIQVH
jgi:hypothetical protein